MVQYFPVITGSLTVQGNVLITGSINTTAGITGSFSGTATTAQTASSVANLNQNVQITGSLGVTSTITAQTLNVQTVTSSIVFSSGSNVFGNSVSNTQQFTGSVLATGSFTVTTTGTEFQVGTTGVRIGNALTDVHPITGSVVVTGSLGIGTSPSFPFDLLTTSSGSFNTIAQIYNNDFTTNNRSYLRVRQQVNAGGSVSSYFGAGQDSNLYIIANNSARGGDLIINGGTGAATFVNSVTGTIFDSTSNAFRLNGNNALSLVTLNAQSVVKINAAGFWGTQLVGANDQGILINNTGNVGIGTTSPSSLGNLTVVMPAASNGTGIVIKAINDGGTASQPALTYLNGSGNYIAQIVGDNGTGYLAFNTGTSNTERLRLTSAGNLNFNTAGSGAAYITINQPTSADGGLLFSRNNVLRFQQVLNGSDGMQFYSYGISTTAFVVNIGGSASLYGALTQNASDRRLKNNIQNIPNALNKINAINGVTFNWENNIFKTNKISDIGVIAQEVQDILPEAVTLAPFDANEDGTSKSGENYLTVYYEKLIPLLIESVKELSAKVDQQQAEIEALKAK